MNFKRQLCVVVFSVKISLQHKQKVAKIILLVLLSQCKEEGITMSLSIRKETDSYKGTALGSVAGVGVGSAYILKNKNDIFARTINESLTNYQTKKYGIIAAAISAIATLLVTTGVGAAAGKLIGSIFDKIKFKKALENCEKTVLKVPFTAPVSEDIKNKTV